ncbi:MAG: winged helix DNA-binding domain-containing protein [Actinomycetota bacterium]|nr:winged helix DNA-binding domain-containing protein [Actinomycetota bacterium]
MAASVVLDRMRVLAFRAAVSGLHRQATRASDVPSLALGVQDSPPGSARLAFAARTAAPPPGQPDPAGWDDTTSGVSAAWTVRGAPHVHPTPDLPRLAAALWPHDDADAASRLAWNAARTAAAGMSPLEAVRTVAGAVAEALAEVGEGAGLAKGALSAAVTARIPAALSPYCRGCDVEHVGEQLLRVAALAGGAGIARTGPLVLAPVDSWPGIPEAPAGTADLVRAYLHLHAPATPADVRAFLGTTTTVVRACWPGDAVEVEGRRAWALPEDLAALHDPPEPSDVRLLPPHDPLLAGSDRWLLLPDPALHKAVWRPIGSPGVVLVRGAPAGVWRAKAARARLDVTVEPFEPLDTRAQRDLEAEAARVAAVRGLPAARMLVHREGTR